MTQYRLDESSPVPVYYQLRQSIIIDIMAGVLKRDDKLPPIRVLAKILKINPNTVAKVYYNLEEEGFVKGKQGSGYTVKAHKGKLDKIKESIIEDELKRLIEKACAMGFTKEEFETLVRRLLNHE